MVKNCDLGLEMFFTIRTSQPANNIYRWSVGDNFKNEFEFLEKHFSATVY